MSSLKRKRDSSIEQLREAPCENSIHQDKKQKRQALRIEIPVSLSSGLLNDQEKRSSPSPLSSIFSAYPDSLFDSNDLSGEDEIVDVSFCATRTAPPIPGLFFESSLLLPQELADSVSSYCLGTYFTSPGVNQVMLFARFLPPPSSTPEISSTINSDAMQSSSSNTGLPNILLGLLDTISTLLKPFLSAQTYTLLFPASPTRARQAIINLYQPGEGITSHIDLLRRYGDGIIGVSFSSSCVMRFDEVESGAQCGGDSGEFQDKRTRWDLYLPERSILVLSQEARYDWTHGIDKKKRDYVSLATDNADQSTSDGTWIERGTRLSITFRWLLPGADVVGNDAP